MSAVPCVVSRDLDRHLNDCDRAEALESAAAEIVPELVAEYHEDITYCGEQLADMEAGWSTADWDEMTGLLLTDPAKYGARMRERLDARLQANAEADAPDVLQELSLIHIWTLPTKA